MKDYWVAQLDTAKSIAVKAHAGQKYGEKDYFSTHVVAVVKRVKEDPHLEDAHVCIAYLHDVLEDSEYTAADLAVEGVDKRVILGVLGMTKPEGQEYLSYIYQMKEESPDAFRDKYKKAIENWLYM